MVSVSSEAHLHFSQDSLWYQIGVEPQSWGHSKCFSACIMYCVASISYMLIHEILTRMYLLHRKAGS